jgi:deoxyribonuclease-4
MQGLSCQLLNFYFGKLLGMVIKLGFHVSISGCLSKSIDNALSLGCTSFQIFTRSPRQWKAKAISAEDSEHFVKSLRKSSITSDSVVVHMPYLPNLSAPESEMYDKSVEVLKDEIIRCNALQIPNLVIHLGSHLGRGAKNGKSQLISACTTAIDNYCDSNTKKNTTKILLENSAGQKNSIGSSIDEISEIFDGLDPANFGLCLDTCHAFGAGYDLTNESGIGNLLDIVSNKIGMEKLKVIHLNDSKGELGSNLDRHYHIGIGKIGEIGFRNLLNNKKLLHIPFIMETPIDSVRSNSDNMAFVKSLLNKDANP